MCTRSANSQFSRTQKYTDTLEYLSLFTFELAIGWEIDPLLEFVLVFVVLRQQI